MDYKGIKIPEKIIIVERQDRYYHDINQGYVVDFGNKKMLESAKDWAVCYVRDETLRQAYYDYRREHKDEDTCEKEADKIWDKYCASEKRYEGIEHVYDNGQFEITLEEAAGGSSQGGKLSFWNCIIKAPDGKEFLVGINSELLLHLMMSNTLVNGKCQEKVFLGRVGGKQVGVFTTNMEDYKQAIQDEKARQDVKKATSNYNPGDIIETLTEKEIYLGSVYQYYNFEEDWHYRDRYLVIYDKPKVVHVFRPFGKHWDTKEEYLSDWYETKNTKVKRLIAGHDDKYIPALTYINNKLEKDMKEAQAYDKKYEGCRRTWDYARVAKKYGDSPTFDKAVIRQYLEDEYQKYCRKWGYHLASEYKVITEEEWEKIKD